MSISRLTPPALQEPQLTVSTTSSSNINLFAASSDLPEIKNGQNAQVQILEQQARSNNHGKHERNYRALVNGNEVVITTDNQLNPGDTLTLEASVQGAIIKFSLPQSASQTNTGDVRSAVQRSFEALLKQLNLNESDVKQTLNALLNPGKLQLQPSDTAPTTGSSTSDFQQILSKLSRAEVLIEPNSLKDPRRLAALLQRGISQDSHQASSARTHLENLALRAASPQLKVAISTLNDLTRQIQNQQTGSSQADTTGFETTVNERGLSGIIKLLASTTSKDLASNTPESERAHQKLTSFLREHIDQVKDLESQMRTTLSTVHRESGLSLLVETLSPYTATPPPDSNEVTRSFYRFASKLHSELAPLQDAPHQRAKLKEVLETALHSLQKQFSESTPESTPSRELTLTPRSDLPRPVANSAKSLYAQIQTVLNSPTINNQDVEQLIAELGKTAAITGQASPAAKLLSEVATIIQKDLQQFLNGDTKNSSLREILQKASTTLMQEFGEQGVIKSTTQPALLLEQISKLIDSQPVKIDNLKLFTETLQTLIKDISPAGSPKDGALVKFVENAIQSLNLTIKNDAPVNTQRDLLLNVQSQLLKNFPEAKIPSSTSGTASGLENLIPNSTLSRQAQNTVRSINAQLNNLLQLLNEGSATSTSTVPPGQVASGSAATQMQQLVDELDKTPPDYALQSSSLPRWTPQEQVKIEQVLRNRGSLELLNFLRSMQLSDLDPTIFDQQVMQFMISLIRDLEESAFKTEKSTRQITRKASERLKDLAEQTKTKSENGESLKKQIKALKTLESILRSNEILAQMNPLLQAAGEPAMLLFPTLIQGMLSSLEVSLYPQGNNVNPDGQNEQHGAGESESLKRLRLSFTLPNLGAIGADVSHGEEEIYLRILVEGDRIKEFLNKRRSMLIKALKKRGYTTTEITISSENPLELQPQWVSHGHESDSIIA